jgi:hypothetical protein
MIPKINDTQADYGVKPPSKIPFTIDCNSTSITSTLFFFRTGALVQAEIAALDGFFRKLGREPFLTTGPSR